MQWLLRTLPVVAVLVVTACDRTDPVPADVVPTPTAERRDSPFDDVTDAVGLDFHHDNGASERFYMPEIMGAGLALIDADADGDLDVYLLQGGPLADEAAAMADRLFRNGLIDESGNDGALGFTDITEAAGIPPGGYGMGVATGDVDGDGFVDLYVTNFGPNRLLRNTGDGRFEDITESSGTADDRWAVPATFFDIDRDGDHDLFVGNYVDFRLTNHKDCFAGTGLPDYCGPHSYSAVPDRLFRNRGDGRFDDISAAAGIRQVTSKALGVSSADFDVDGYADLYVANDGVANQLWMNSAGDGFNDKALMAGSALNYEGSAEASMGVDAADVDGDGYEDLFMTHLRGETNTLYLNRGDASFEDRTIRFGLAGPSLPLTGFGTAWIDVDNDGDLDLMSVNGAVTVEEHLAQAGDPFPFHQRNQLFLNVSDDNGLLFEEFVGEDDGPFAVSEVSRGAAFGDLDNDGDLDVVISNNGGRARVLLNAAGQENNWLGLSLYANENGTHALGAAAEIVLPDGRTMMRRVRTSGSYASANDPRLLFGLGQTSADSELQVTVRWGDGSVEQFGPLTINQYHELIRGNGRDDPSAGP